MEGCGKSIPVNEASSKTQTHEGKRSSSFFVFPCIWLLIALLSSLLSFLPSREVVRGVVPPAVQEQVLPRQLHTQVQAARAALPLRVNVA